MLGIAGLFKFSPDIDSFSEQYKANVSSFKRHSPFNTQFVLISVDHCFFFSDVAHLANKITIRSISDIDELYSGIVVIVNLATYLFIPKVKFKPYIKQYWNDSLKTAHKI
jgi:hypothetical protein